MASLYVSRFIQSTWGETPRADMKESYFFWESKSIPMQMTGRSMTEVSIVTIDRDIGPTVGFDQKI